MQPSIWPRLAYFLKDFSLYLIALTVSFLAFIFTAYKISKSSHSQKKKGILLALLATAFSIILIFSIFEAYFRYVYDESDGLGFLKVNQKWHQRHVVFNNYFFRDRDFNPVKQEGVIRIGVLGDSITQGDGIKNVNDRYSNVLENTLKAAGYKVEVYTIGKSGYDTEGEIDVYNSVKDLNFDIIIWAYFVNDIQPKDASTGTPIITKNSQRAKILKLAADNSYFLDYLYWRFSSVYNKTILALRTADVDQYKNPDRLIQHEKAITDFISTLKAENKKIIVIMFPSISFLQTDYPTFINDIMHNIFSKNEVQYIDLYDYLKGQDPKNLRASRFDTHPNEKVHKLAAEKLYKEVVSILKPEASNSAN